MPMQKTTKELLAERARIDAAMAQLEGAKMQAAAQRAEFGRFLTWKVDLQRKERKQREEETNQLRERVEKKLAEVLRVHREQRKAETHKYREFATAKVPRESLSRLRIANSLEAEEEILAEAMAEKARRREEWERFRAEMGVRTAPARSTAGRRHSDSGKDTKRTGAQPYVGQTPRAPPGSMGSHGSTAPLQYECDDEDQFDRALLKDKVGHLETLVQATREHGEEAQEMVALAKEGRLKTIAQTESRQNAVRQRAEMMESMYAKARTRRMYAQGRIAADPPADYLIGTDILRYIPVDLIPGGAQFGEAPQEKSPKGAAARSQLSGQGPAFFMTAVDSSRADEAAPNLSSGPAPPQGAAHPSTSPTNEKDFRRLKKGSFDPLFRKLGGPAPDLKQERIPEEEMAMYEWYKAQESTKRQPKWRSQSYSWTTKTAALEAQRGNFHGGPHRVLGDNSVV